jgi:hypothetical protein
MPVGYLIFGGLLCFAVSAVTVLGERPGRPAHLTRRVFAAAGTGCWALAVSILILRIP